MVGSCDTTVCASYRKCAMKLPSQHFQHSVTNLVIRTREPIVVLHAAVVAELSLEFVT